jgi:hypothetical protein
MKRWIHMQRNRRKGVLGKGVNCGYRNWTPIRSFGGTIWLQRQPSHLLRRDVTGTTTHFLLVAVVVLGLEFFIGGTVHAAGGFLKGLATAGHLYEAH